MMYWKAGKGIMCFPSSGSMANRNRCCVREMDRIRACGIKAVCIEARPHPDFAGAGWWHDLDIVMDEARTHGMRVWVLDDAHFPTGFANGAIRDRFPGTSEMVPYGAASGYRRSVSPARPSLWTPT